MRRFIGTLALTGLLALGAVGTAGASTVVPGQQGRDGTVTGRYTAVFAYDAEGGYFLDYGDDRPGNPAGTVGSIDELDQDTLTVCTYRTVYRGDFGDDPFLDEGWTANHINCKGYEKATEHNRSFHGGDHPQPELEILSGVGRVE